MMFVYTHIPHYLLSTIHHLLSAHFMHCIPSTHTHTHTDIPRFDGSSEVGPALRFTSFQESLLVPILEKKKADRSEYELWVLLQTMLDVTDPGNIHSHHMCVGVCSRVHAHTNSYTCTRSLTLSHTHTHTHLQPSSPRAVASSKRSSSRPSSPPWTEHTHRPRRN
jgi:hypothetical protein